MRTGTGQAVGWCPSVSLALIDWLKDEKVLQKQRLVKRKRKKKTVSPAISSSVNLSACKKKSILVDKHGLNAAISNIVNVVKIYLRDKTERWYG